MGEYFEKRIFFTFKWDFTLYKVYMYKTLVLKK